MATIARNHYLLFISKAVSIQAAFVLSNKYSLLRTPRI